MSQDEAPSSPEAERVFEVLLRQNAAPLIAFIRSMLGASPLVDDVFQETAMVAWRRFDDFDPSRPFGPWLRGIAARTAMAASRKHGRERPATEELLVAIESRVQRIEALGLEDPLIVTRELEDCVRELPEAYRDCIECQVRGTVAISEIAFALELGIEVVKKRLQRGRRRLADCLRKKGVFA